MDSNSTVYFLTGLGIGAAIGILYAPQSGPETRDLLRSKSMEGKKYAEETASQAAERVKQKAEETKKAAVDAVERRKRTVTAPLENLRSAVEAGKKAYREAQNKPEPAESAT